MSKDSGGFSKIIVWLLAVILIVAVFGVALSFGLREQGMTYYVEYNGQRYMGGMDNENIVLQTGKLYKFSVKSLTGGEIDFDVKITSNVDNDIMFSYNGELRHLYEGSAETDDYSDVFGLQLDTDGFTVTIPQDMSVETAIETKLGGDITFLDEFSDSKAYFVITVMVGKNSVALPFTFGVKVSGVTLNPPQVIF